MRYLPLLWCAAAYLVFSTTVAQTLGQEIRINPHGPPEMVDNQTNTLEAAAKIYSAIAIFMCGDVMTGRGIDQVLPHPNDPTIYESYMKSARGYVEIAERLNGPIGYPVGFSYVWGDALNELERSAPDVRIINLETSITKSSDYWKGKGINYRMHPENVSVLTAAKINICSLANNHVLDWGYSGLLETLDSLKKANIKTAGAGRNLREARMPAVIKVPGKGRVIVLAFGMRTSGIPSDWGAGDKKAGVNLLKNLNDESLGHIGRQVGEVKRRGDIIVASIHWGSNWGYAIPREQTVFAHRLIDEAGVDIVHGHSSHHVRPIEVYKDKLILYGCGDFLNDYEGISGYEEFRADLSLMYFATVEPATGHLLGLQMTPTQIKKFRVRRASGVDTFWLRDMLNKEGAAFGTQVKVVADHHLALNWD